MTNLSLAIVLIVVNLFGILVGQQFSVTFGNGMCMPNPISSGAAQFSAPMENCGEMVRHSITKGHPDQFKNTSEILNTYHYPHKVYKVTTKDGYILTVYRITDSPKIINKTNEKKQAVYLQHGLTMASDCWNFQPGNRNLPFKLADAGYEVWLGNARGTSYSLGHKKLHYDANWQEYWDFSWHEMGVYDVPAVTDKILEETNSKKIFYIGQSMGTTQFLVMLSELPKMNDKFIAGFLLSPVAYHGHMNHQVRRTFVFLDTDEKYQISNLAMRGRGFTRLKQLRSHFGITPGQLCDPVMAKCGLCDNFVFAYFGYNPSQINVTELPNLFSKFPNSFSMKTLAHFAQTATTCTFKKYDYGPVGNYERYGSLTAPDYNLKNVKVPLYIWHGEEDNWGPPNDVNITVSKLPKKTLKRLYKVKDHLFNHMDFITGIDADKFCYNKLLSKLQKYK